MNGKNFLVALKGIYWYWHHHEEEEGVLCTGRRVETEGDTRKTDNKKMVFEVEEV